MKSLGLRAVFIAVCLIAFTIFLASVAKASISTSLLPEKDSFFKEADWAKVIQPGYKPHQEIFAKLNAGMSGEEAKRIIRESFQPFRERLEVEGAEMESRITWNWGNSFLVAEGITAERSRLTVLIEECRVSMIVLEFAGNYPTRIFRQGRKKTPGSPESNFGANEDKGK